MSCARLSRNARFRVRYSSFILRGSVGLLRRLEGHSDNSISLILCWILQAEYLYATGQLRSAKETIVRARSRAESLNPRKKSTKNPDNVPAAEKVFIQLGRAIWLGIQAIEQSLCLHLGKGTDGTSSETVPHPTSLVLKASQFPGDTLGEESLKGLILGLFTCCGELFRIMSKLPLERACGVTEGRCPLEKLQNAEIDPFTDVSQVENALHSWRRRLPQPLQWTGGIESNPRNEDPESCTTDANTATSKIRLYVSSNVAAFPHSRSLAIP